MHEQRPSDARVLGELGWAAFKANQLALAHEANEFIHRHGGHAYAVVEVTYSIRDADEGIEQVSFDMARSVVACRAEGPVARCASFYVDSDFCSGGLFDDLDCKPMDTYRIVGDEVVVRHGKQDVRLEPIEAGLHTSLGPLP